MNIVDNLKKRIKYEKKLILGNIAAALLFSGCYNIGQGEKIGQVVKINEASGIFCKTIEVEIIRGGFSNGSGTNDQALYFTIENNPDSLDIVKKAMENGSEIKVQYHQELATICRSDSGSTFGDKIEVINSNFKTKTYKDTNGSVNTTYTNIGNLQEIKKLDQRIENDQMIIIKLLSNKK